MREKGNVPRGGDHRINRKRQTLVMRRALELAKSGAFSGWSAIESKLKDLGFTEAAILLQNHFVREHLNGLCKHAEDDQLRLRGR